MSRLRAGFILAPPLLLQSTFQLVSAILRAGLKNNFFASFRVRRVCCRNNRKNLAAFMPQVQDQDCALLAREGAPTLRSAPRPANKTLLLVTNDAVTPGTH